LLSQTCGTQGESLKYVALDAVMPAVFADDAEKRMYQLPLTGGAFEEDNKQTFRLLKSYLINMPGWTWIESFNATSLPLRISAKYQWSCLKGPALYMSWK
jgi:hypothetical protein